MTIAHPASMPQRVTDVCNEILPVESYRTPRWHEARLGAVSASEIAVVLGLSRFQSRFDLWWSKRLGTSGVPDNGAMSRGRRVEPLVLEDFIEEHPHYQLRHVGLVQNLERPYQVATPDAIAYESRPAEFGERMTAGESWDAHWSECEPVAVVEAKTDGGSDHWGERGTDEIPVDYKAQVIWQMDTLGLDFAYVPVWIGFTYRCYEVRLDLDDALFMREQAREFLDSLKGENPPPVDSHRTTTERLKALHPTVVDEEVVVPETLAAQYLAAQNLRDTATARMALAENRLRALIGNAKRGVLLDGRRIANRSVYDVKAREQTIGEHTVDKLLVRAPKGTRTHGKAIDIRPVRCAGTTARGQRCRRTHPTSAETWTCPTHRSKP